jgi:ABC-type Fe3+ transport system permease subunit
MKQLGKGHMRGAIVFVVVFVIFLLATIEYSSLSPGKQVYDALKLPTTNYKVLGLAATTLIVAIFNAVIYGIIAWLIYTIADRVTKRKPRAKQSQ